MVDGLAETQYAGMAQYCMQACLHAEALIIRNILRIKYSILIKCGYRLQRISSS